MLLNIGDKVKVETSSSCTVYDIVKVTKTKAVGEESLSGRCLEFKRDYQHEDNILPYNGWFKLDQTKREIIFKAK